MKCQIPQISWHGRDPVLSMDFQPGKRCPMRLASGGTDAAVLMWYVTYQENGSIKIDCASELHRHNKSVNVVRFSPNGELLASGDDEGAMFLWQLKEREGIDGPKDEENANQEDWYPLKLLRGHLEDIYDISWSSDGNFLVSASMDNTAIVWDMQKFQKIHIFSDFKGYVQGVAWDPKNVFIASIGTDRTLRIHNINTKKTMYRVFRAPWTVTTEKGTLKARLFYDDTLKSYTRRLTFTPDGELLIVPSGIIETEDKLINATYLFSRFAPNKPAIKLPTGDKYTVAARCNPFLYKLRKSKVDTTENKENEDPKPMIDLPYRMVFAVAACDSILFYDTEQLLPFGYVSNIHYTHLTDLAWSSNGKILAASSSDGYCSFVVFSDEELGEVYVPPEPVPETVEVPPSQTQDVPAETNKKVAQKVADTPVDSVKPAIVVDKVATAISPAVKTPVVAKEKPNKTPKSYSIKNFFVSPRPSPATKPTTSEKKNILKSKESTPSSKSSTVRDDNKIPDDLSHFEFVKSSPSASGSVPSCDVVKIDKKDESSVEFLCEAPNSEDALKKKPKCKTQLDFASSVTAKNDIETKVKQDLKVQSIGEEAVLSFGEITEEINPEVTINTETDWKLEFSQDEDIAPMEVEEEKKDEKLASESVNQGETPKPKRRVPFITLSTKSPKG